MKKGVKRKTLNKYKGSVKKSKVNYELKKSLAYKLLIIFFIILTILIIAVVVMFLIEISHIKGPVIPEKTGELGTSGIFISDVMEISADEILEVVSYSFQNDNQSVQVIVRRDALGLGILEKIIMVFNKSGEYCSYNQTADLPMPDEIRAYDIAALQTDCGNNFTNVNEILAAGIKAKIVNLTQTANIPDFSLNEGEYYPGLIDLDDYFANLTDIDGLISVDYPTINQNIQIMPAGDFIDTHKINFNASFSSGGNYVMNITLSYPGLQDATTNNFNISVSAINQNCTDSDGGENYTFKGTTTNATYSLTDSCYNSSSVQEFYCSGTRVAGYVIPCNHNYYCNDGACIKNISVNRTPEFISENCSSSKVSWNKNSNFTLNLASCFKDPDRDSLIFRIVNNESSHLNMKLTGSLLLLIPEREWAGTGSFFAYANDSINEIMGRIYFKVNGTGIIPLPNITNIINETFKIKNPSPEGDSLTVFAGDNMSFFIANTDYDSIEWYLDGKIIKTNSNICDLVGLSKGNYSLEVRIKKGAKIDSKIWRIIIESDEIGKNFIFDKGKVIFYLIFIVVLIIIGLIIWLFFEEKKRKKKKINLDLNVIEGKKSPSEFPGAIKQQDMSKRFNIPK